MRAYVAGGDDSSATSTGQRRAIEAMLTGMEVRYGTGPYSAGGHSQYLVASIDEDGEVFYGMSNGR